MPLHPGQAAHHGQQAGAIQRLLQRPEQLAFGLRLHEQHAAGVQPDGIQPLAAGQPPAARGGEGLHPHQAALGGARQARGDAQKQRQGRRPVRAPLPQKLVNAGPFQHRKRPVPLPAATSGTRGGSRHSAPSFATSRAAIRPMPRAVPVMRQVLSRRVHSSIVVFLSAGPPSLAPQGCCLWRVEAQFSGGGQEVVARLRVFQFPGHALKRQGLALDVTCLPRLDQQKLVREI